MQSPIPPPILNPNRPPEPFAKQYLLGLAGGSLLSLILWGLGWNALDHGPAATLGAFAILAVPFGKLSFGILMIVRKTYKGAGAGLITSIAVGALIFFGTCLTHMKP